MVDEKRQVLATARRRTPSRDPGHIADVVVEIVAQLRAEHDVAAVGIGAAGFVDSSALDRAVRRQPGLARLPDPGGPRRPPRPPGHRRERRQRRRVGRVPVRGRRPSRARLIVLTIGTGIGCRPDPSTASCYRGRFGIAGEPGHMRVVPGGRLCGCGNRGCLEQYCSGTALVRAAREVAQRATRPTPPGCSSSPAATSRPSTGRSSRRPRRKATRRRSTASTRSAAGSVRASPTSRRAARPRPVRHRRRRRRGGRPAARSRSRDLRRGPHRPWLPPAGRRRPRAARRAGGTDRRRRSRSPADGR